ncbi:uncharacterized protein [Nicotiana tomentosiformis]|uniref:uncharacterized protein isoform X7 n=1 Tax=Nicotiana tomentosiformis TaxID=4098 RepID=UPI00388C3CA9
MSSFTFSPTHSLCAPPTLPFKSYNSTNSSIFAIFSFKCQKHVISRNGKSGSVRKGNGFPAMKLKSSDQEMETQDSSETSEINVGLSSSSSPSTSLLSFLCPLLKLFSGGDPSSKRNYLLEEATSRLSTLARLPWGSRAQYGKLGSKDGSKVNPLMHLQIFEFGDIVKYLFQQYGQGRNPSTGLLESTIVTGWMPTLLRAGRGMALWDRSRKEPPPKKLELFSYENNPYARIVREALCELELPYILNNIGEGSAREELLIQISGGKEVPYLVDPNTGTQIGDYKKITSYLFQTYSLDAL